MSSADQHDPNTVSQATDSDHSAPMNIPPASFSTLVQMLATQSMAALGMIPGPDGKSRKEPAIAKHFIDLMSVLESKCQGNLEPAEANMLDSLLHDLRMAYIQATK